MKRIALWHLGMIGFCWDIAGDILWEICAGDLLGIISGSNSVEFCGSEFTRSPFQDGRCDTVGPFVSKDQLWDGHRPYGVPSANLLHSCGK